ncbi:MAG TPA: DinB family protein [Fimbriimonas sp.]|nr:DinB family protein [Fimbriimonas sp.]
MHLQLRNRFEALEERKKAFIARIKALPVEAQSHRPSPNRFSPVEVAMHLALSQRASTEAAKKLRPETAKAMHPRPTFLYKQTVANLKAANRWLPTFGARVPSAGSTLDQAEQTWDWAQSDLKSLLEWAEHPQSVVTKEFPFGVLSAAQLLDLFDAHLHYHEARFPV